MLKHDKSFSSAPPDIPENPHYPLSTTAFIVILAALMAINALATDIMLPGFPQIGADLGTDTTSVQAVITAYMFGFGSSQIFMGFLADRYGRRPVLIGGLVLYGIASILCAATFGLGTMLAARFVQGVGAGAPRVIVGAVARDCYDGRRLARVMSLVMTLFMVAPVVAPAIGQLIILLAGWRSVFGALFLYALVMLAICWRSFPETLKPERRRAIRLAVIGNALASIFGSRQTLGYTLAAGAFFGALFGFIASAQQILADVFDLGVWFPLSFAAMALSLSLSSFLNAGLVERFGMRLLSHSAVVAYTLLSLLMFALSMTDRLGIGAFMVIHSANLMLVGLVFANFNALAMEPQGHVAGVASAFVSAITVFIGAGAGYFIGAAFDGSTHPLATGFVLSGVVTLVILLITERGRLFHGRNQ